MNQDRPQGERGKRVSQTPEFPVRILPSAGRKKVFILL
jgi:hypothetical protein